MTTPLDIAKKYINYTEYPPNSNQTLFGAWYGMNGVPWCMEFVQFCFAQADHALPYKTASCSALLDWYKAYKPNLIKVMPMPNDIVIYRFGHTGIVESGNSQAVTAIEGNTSPGVTGSQDNGGGVYRRTRTADTVAGYIRAFDFTKPQESDHMTRDEILNELGDKWIASINDLPAWAKPDVRELLDQQIINGGTDYAKDPDDINMFLSDIKTIIAMKRLIDKK